MVTKSGSALSGSASKKCGIENHIVLIPRRDRSIVLQQMSGRKSDRLVFFVFCYKRSRSAAEGRQLKELKCGWRMLLMSANILCKSLFPRQNCVLEKVTPAKIIEVYFERSLN